MRTFYATLSGANFTTLGDYCFNIDGGCIFTNNLNYITIFSDGKFSIKQFKLDTM
jgi:hypothetical protein